MNKLRLFIVSIFFLIPMLMFAQRTVKGVVTEQSSGQPLPGVNIQIQGTNQGTTTDFDGNYVLENVNDGSVLEFSYIGYETQSIPVATGTINVALLEGAESLEEVVVIGYGTARKEDLTGSVNQVTTKDFNKGAITSPHHLITGKIAGVSVTSNGGAPGEGSEIRIRGMSSLSLLTQPLYVLDGFPLDADGVGGDRSPLNLINPNDIESIVVLKDASATAIYGSRAANGVIMITTKKGKDKGFVFNYGTKASFYRPFQTVDVLSPNEFRELVISTGDIDAIDRLGEASTDWQREIYADALGIEHNISGTGNAFGVLPMRASVGYTNQDGILKGDNLERTTAALSFNPSLLDNHLKVEINARGTYIENEFANKDAIGSAIRFDPTQNIYDTTSPYDGYFSWINPTTDLQYNFAPTNPIALQNLKEDFAFINRYIGNAKFDYKLHFFPAITATVNVGMDKSTSDGKVIESEFMPNSDTNWDGSFESNSKERENKLLDAYFNYAKDFNDHNFSLTAGHSYQFFSFDNYQFDGEDYAVYLDGNSSQQYEYIDKEEESLLSYFGRLNYKFSNKYLLTATLRADASSKLNPDDRWGYFPSVALAWNLHNENFLANSKFDELKLRVGYGEVGNVNGLDPYKFLTRYDSSESNANYQLGDSFYQTYRPAPTNKDIKWEIGKTTNIGLDYSLFNRRLYGSVNVYQKETKDLIIKALIDPFINFGNRVEANVGDMVNKGIEVELNGVIARTDEVIWDINYNVSFNDNEVTYMPFLQDVGGIEGGVGNKVQIHTEGYSPFSFNVYQQVYDTDGRPIEGVYVDRNDDGIINNEDKYLYKDPLADIQMGLSSTLRIDNFDLSVTTRANIGNYMYDNVASSKALLSDVTRDPYLINLHADYFNTGFENQTETNFLSDHYVTDASFIKIDNITMGLSFPDFFKAADVRVFATVQNVATFTEYTGLDPEIDLGIDNNFYPRPRTFTFGFNLDF